MGRLSIRRVPSSGPSVDDDDDVDSLRRRLLRMSSESESLGTGRVTSYEAEFPV